MNILGLGTDIVEIERIHASIEKHGSHFLDRLFTEKEKLYCLQYKDAAPRFAGRFAAKEAIVKALGTGIGAEVGWQEIEILNDPQGKPEVHLAPLVKERFNVASILLSISHCESYATATALVIGLN